MKVFQRIQRNTELLSKLSIAVAIHFIDKLGDRPDPQKIFIAGVLVCIRPYSNNDLAAHQSPNVPLNLLLEKPMMGTLNFYGVLDETDQYNDVDAVVDLWHGYRNYLDNNNHRDVPLVVLQLCYEKVAIANGPLPIYPIDIERAKILLKARSLSSHWQEPSNPMLE